MKSEK
jgi:hypothetical protein